MKTALMLLVQFEKPLIPLDDIAEEYFGLNPEQARRKLKAGQLGIKAIQLTPSIRSPWLIHVNDLADYIDQTRHRET